MANKIRVIFVSLLVFMFLTCVSAEDLVGISTRISEAQGALNVKGFDVAATLGSTFTDLIDPATGSLTISQTDFVLNGRNNNNVILSRRYSNNVFLSLNQYWGGSANCIGPTGSNTIACDATDPYVKCTMDQNQLYNQKIMVSDGSLSTGSTRSMHRCQEIALEDTSFSRAKYLGQGWTLNYLENRIKDPTSLVFGDELNNDGKLEALYDYIPLRGTNFLSMVLDNNEQQLILPSMFELPLEVDDPISRANTYWGYDLAYESQSSFYDNDAITRIQTEWINNDDYEDYLNHQYSYFTYTNSLEPVWFVNNLYGSNVPNAVSQNVNYYSKDGKTYSFNHNVKFCGVFDDMKVPGLIVDGSCASVLPYNGPNTNKVMNWAENPYAGIYLTTIIDDFGNMITINYKGEGSPFVESIIAPGGKMAEFTYAPKNDPESFGMYGQEYDLNTRLRSIKLDQPIGGAKVYRIYQYKNTAGVPLLGYSFLSASPYCYADNTCVIKGTQYQYNYDSNTRELTQVMLPTGATINYEYAWATNIPSFDPIRQISSGNEYPSLNRRVVIKKTIINGGKCGPTEDCSWNYKYITQDVLNMKTIVTDPFGNEIEYKLMPTTTSSPNLK